MGRIFSGRAGEVYSDLPRRSFAPKSNYQRVFMRVCCWSSIGFVFSALCFAQPAAYDPRLTFAPLTLPDPVNAYRSGNGTPGPSYWQNEADYELHAALDTNAKTLQNDETITYTNNSPDALTSLWIQLDQNIYRKDSRGYLVNGGLRRKKPVADSEENPNGRTTEGYALDSVEIEH